MPCALSMSHTLNLTFVSFGFVSDKVFLCGNSNASGSLWRGLVSSPEKREVSLDLNGNGGMVGGGPSHINRLFHLQRCTSECVTGMEEAPCRGAVRGIENSTVQFSKMFQKKRKKKKNHIYVTLLHFA